MLNSSRRVLFSATDDRGDEELWVTSLDEEDVLTWSQDESTLLSDTARHTRRVENICNHCSSMPRDLVDLRDGYVYFAATSDLYGRELYRSDGTSVTLVKDIHPGSGSRQSTFLDRVSK